MNTKKIILINIIIIFIFIIIFSFVLNKNNKEVLTWNIAIKENSISSINSYLQKYPKGIFINSAQFKLDELTWNEAVLSNSYESYKKYKELFPKGEFVIKADSMLYIYSKNRSDSLSLTFDKVVGSKIFFKDGRSFNTNRFEIGYIGKILDQKKNMFYVFSGRDCIECDAEPTLYLISTKQNSNPCEYPYPGTEKYYMTGEIIYKSRAFWGEILNNVYGIVIYQIFYDDKIETERNCYLVSIENGKVNETKFNDYNAKLKQTQTLQKKGLCKEIQGKEYTTSP